MEWAQECVAELLEEPWDKGKGRPRGLTFREALIVACGYARNNITEEIWAEIFDVGQSTISRYITFLTPLIDQATAGFRPSAEEAAEATRGAIALGRQRCVARWLAQQAEPRETDDYRFKKRGREPMT